MEPIKQKSKLYRQIKNTLQSDINIGMEFPQSFTYCEGLGKPVFTFTIERKQEDHFIDKNGQKWIKAPE